MNQIETCTSTPLPFGESDIQVRTAKMYPRDVRKCLEEAEHMATLSEEIAASCFYSLPRKSKNQQGVMEVKNLQGASVRLAEIIASAWGNVYAATRIADNDGLSITAEAYCWDLEKNVRIGTQVKRSITTKEGRRFSQDMQTVTENAASSIALRNAIFKVIPRSYVEDLYKKCQEKALGNGNAASKFEGKRQAVFDRFKALGISEEKIFNFFGKTSIKEFDMEDVKNLIGMGTAINDGHLKLEEAFQLEYSKSDELADRLGGSDNE